MSITLHLGVMDIPYPAPVPKQRKVPIKPRKKPLKRPIQQRLPLSIQKTTGEVAMILEQKYHVLQRIFELHKEQIAQSMAEEIQGHLVGLMAGGPMYSSTLGGVASEITDILKQGISQRELDGYPGIPTLAARRGVNHRLLHPYARGNPERPSFIDTSQYQTSIMSWFDLR